MVTRYLKIKGEGDRLFAPRPVPFCKEDGIREVSLGNVLLRLVLIRRLW